MRSRRRRASRCWLGPGLRCSLLAALVAACSGDQSRAAQAEGRDGGDAAVPAAATDREAGEAPEGAAEPYRLAPLDPEGEVEGSGALEVVVSWPEPPPAVLRSPGLNRCGVPTRPPAKIYIRTKKEDVTGLPFAVVSLLGVERGRRPDPPRPVELAVRDCRLRPVVARVARLGGRVAVMSDDERRHQVILEHLGDGGGAPELLARIPLPLVGQRYELTLDRPGLVRARSSIDPRDHAYLVVPGHPYVAVAGETGLARLAEVPAGEHEVAAWHPPIEPGGGALVGRGKATVKAGRTTRMVLTLSR